MFVHYTVGIKMVYRIVFGSSEKQNGLIWVYLLILKLSNYVFAGTSSQTLPSRKAWTPLAVVSFSSNTTIWTIWNGCWKSKPLRTSGIPRRRPERDDSWWRRPSIWTREKCVLCRSWSSCESVTNCACFWTRAYRSECLDSMAEGPSSTSMSMWVLVHVF